MVHTPKSIILASSSPYRRELLERLQLPFTVATPDVDETPKQQETAEELVVRLARLKAETIAKNASDALIIGSDQVASMGTMLLSKPGNRDRAREQLLAIKGHAVAFITGLCVLNSRDMSALTGVVSYTVFFRDYIDEEIERYLSQEQPYDCAGSFKSERLGITLVSRMQGEDPTALMGLPLIRLSEMLREYGLNLP